MQVTIEYFESLDNDDLHTHFWDMYKEVNGIRPRWVDPSDREYMLSWMADELSPERIAQRIAEFEEQIDRMADEYEEWLTARNEEEAEYEAKMWFELEESLCA